MRGYIDVEAPRGCKIPHLGCRLQRGKHHLRCVAPGGFASHRKYSNQRNDFRVRIFRESFIMGFLKRGSFDEKNAMSFHSSQA